MATLQVSHSFTAYFFQFYAFCNSLKTDILEESRSLRQSKSPITLLSNGQNVDSTYVQKIFTMSQCLPWGKFPPLIADGTKFLCTDVGLKTVYQYDAFHHNSNSSMIIEQYTLLNLKAIVLPYYLQFKTQTDFSLYELFILGNNKILVTFLFFGQVLSLFPDIPECYFSSGFATLQSNTATLHVSHSFTTYLSPFQQTF